MEQLLQAAVEHSFLAELPADVVAELVDGACGVSTPAGSSFGNTGRAPAVHLVASGLLRFVRVASDGRTIAQRHLRCGDVAGIGMVFNSLDAGKPTARAEALADSVVYELSPHVWRRVAERDARVAVAMLKDLSRVAEIAIDEMAERALAPLRHRVVRQLLEAAEPNGGTELVATITQQQLADGVGSVREAVARILFELRKAGLIETQQGRVVIRDRRGLDAELSAT